MKAARFLILMVFIFSITSCDKKGAGDPEQDVNAVSGRDYYELKVYSFENDDQVAMTDRYLEQAYLPALKKSGIGQVGVFKFRTTDIDTIQKTFVLIPFSSIEQFLSLDEKLSKDEVYLESGSQYLNATYDQPPYARIETTLMKAFTDMPEMQVPSLDGPRAERIYELRSYESPTEQYYKNKVDMFNAGGEIKLFDRLEFNAVFYAEVLSGAKMPNLIYMTTFSDMTTRDVLWKAFFDAPEWKELIAMSKYKNNVSHADIILLYPTEYSDY